MRFCVWTGVEEWLAEAAYVDLRAGGMTATGVQLGAHPVPYRIDYRLDASAGFVTKELDLTAAGEGWRRRLLLRSGRGRLVGGRRGRRRSARERLGR